MRTMLALVIASALAAGAALDDQTLAKEGDRWWKHVEVIASDAMAGRDTASPGHKAAADYVAAEFKRAGLEHRSARQKFQRCRIWRGLGLDEHRIRSLPQRVQGPRAVKP